MAEHGTRHVLPSKMWWEKGRCVVDVIKTGHFPTSVVCKLPNDVYTEIELADLEDRRHDPRG